MHFLLLLILLTIWSFIASPVLSDGQYGLEDPAIKLVSLSGHSHGFERRSIFKNHKKLLKQRSTSPDENTELKTNKTENIEPNNFETETPKTEQLDSENLKKEILEKVNSKCGTPLPHSGNKVPPGKKPPTVIPSPPKNPGRNSTKPLKPGNGMPSTGAMTPMKYGWDDSGKFFASIWDNKLGGSYTALSDNLGAYSVSWNGVDDIVIGKGWRKGSTDRVVDYFSTFSVNGNGAYLSLYGWSTNLCREYYVTESWGVYKPCNGPPAINKGTFESDGDTYTACIVPRTSKCIDGSDGFVQFWSVRNTKRTSGRITFANHVKAWQRFGMHLGILNFPQIMAVEAYARSSGSAIVAIQEARI